MAIIKLNYLSKALLRTVDVTVVLPTDTLDMDTMTYNQKKEYKTLYLLHGIFGDQNDWLYCTIFSEICKQSHYRCKNDARIFFVQKQNNKKVL
jgi:pimeloyl-ACP methyl ester carboxylesterase